MESYGNDIEVDKFLSWPKGKLYYSDIINTDNDNDDPEYFDYINELPFWRFIRDFILKFYGKAFEEFLQDRDLQRSFVYANVNSIPRYSVCAKNSTIDKSNLVQIKAQTT